MKTTATFFRVLGLIIFLSSTHPQLLAQNAENLTDSAMALIKEHKFASAVSVFNRLIQTRSLQADELYHLAQAYSQLGKSQKAIECLKKALTRKYPYTAVYYDLHFKPLWGLPEFLALDIFRPPGEIYFFDIINKLQQARAENTELVLISDQVYVSGGTQGNLDHYSITDIEDRIQETMKDSLIDFSGIELNIKDTKFQGNGTDLKFLRLGKLHFDFLSGELSIRHIKTGYLLIHNSELSWIEFDDVHQNGLLQINNIGTNFLCTHSSFHPGLQSAEGKYYVSGYYNKGFNLIDLNASEEIKFVKCEFLATSDDVPLLFQIKTKALEFSSSIIGQPIIFKGDCEYLNLHSNQFNRFVDFMKFKMPEFNAYIPFNQFRTQFVEMSTAGEVKGDSIEDIRDPVFYDQLVSIYKTLYNNYRNRGELNSANNCYITLKELEIQSLKRKSNMLFKEKLRLRLNQIMGFYTDHGTNPAKAIIISTYIIVLFAIFYFFFPSEWDRDSKSKLLDEFRKLIRKNEHGYFWPFVSVTKGFLLSFLNAITLSTNAFITLGFGRIPTTGAARYICVFQGLLGWFLLSLFTVSLINQVLL